MRSLDLLFKPIRLAWRGWMAFSHVLGLVMSTILLTILWIVGFGSYAVATSIAGLRGRKPAISYWQAAIPQRHEDLLRQF